MHRYKNYLLTVLLIILAFNWMERMAVGVVLESIKADLHLSDTQLGLLSGIAFAVFYAVMGIPIARWADRGNRVTIITVTTALWGAAVALCGAAGSFMQLLSVRVAVAVGEAGCVPPAHSLIADNFTRAERPRAVARYMLGGPLAIILGYFGAGWLNEVYGWRITFILLGLPGLILAALVWFTLREPRRASPAVAASDAANQPSVREVCVTLWKNAAFRNLLFCFSVWYFFGYGLMQWAPAFFIRSHGLTTGEIGTWFSLVSGVVSLVAVYMGGELAARYAAGNERLQLRACAIGFMIFSVFSAMTYLAPNHYLAMGAVALTSLSNMTQGPILATIQTLVPSRMRAMSLAIIYLFANLIGMGLGPLAAGALSDWLHPRFGDESLRYALVILSPGYFWAAWHLWRAGETVARDMAALHVNEGDANARAV
jgi:MFS transporter, Spinster family, sphingosine-1-phosphate transporter